MKVNFGTLILLLSIVVLITGCGLFTPFLKETCGMCNVLKKRNDVSFAINLANKKIEVGMAKEIVIEAWGKPNYDDFEREQLGRYGWDINGSKDISHVSYLVTFENNIIKKIEEFLWKKEYQCRINDL